ncbi:MAG TPA: hypothetical protein VNL74_11785 [Methylococcus sp.]|nr:hypothetical protein [Methylococcus sp.]
MTVRILKILAIVLPFGTVTLCLVLLLLAVEPQPLLIPRPGAVNTQDAHEVFRETWRKTGVVAGKKTVQLSANDLEAAVNFLITRKRLKGVINASFEEDRLRLIATLRLPIPPAAFLNLRLLAEDGNPNLRITTLQIGKLVLPGILVDGFLQSEFRRRGLLRDGTAAPGMIESIRIIGDRLHITLGERWHATTQLRKLVDEAVGRDRLVAYHERLVTVVNESGSRRFIRLGQLFRPLFLMALQRSQENDPALENKAVILLLATYVNGYDLLLGAGTGASALPTRVVLLRKREDLSRHFLTSAALSLAGHRSFAEMIGMAKELNDTHSGSGFSFTDLAANQAGTLFGKRASSSRYARKIQRILSENAEEAVFLPDLSDLPENLHAPDFRERFGDIYSSAFERYKCMIEERITRLPLYSELDAQVRDLRVVFFRSGEGNAIIGSTMTLRST